MLASFNIEMVAVVVVVVVVAMVWAPVGWTGAPGTGVCSWAARRGKSWVEVSVVAWLSPRHANRHSQGHTLCLASRHGRVGTFYLYTHKHTRARTHAGRHARTHTCMPKR